MLKQYSKELRVLLRLVDVVIALAAFQAAYYIRYGSLTPDVMELGAPHLVFLVIYVLAWADLSERLTLYDSKRMSGIGNEMYALLKATVASTAFAFGLAFLFRGHAINSDLVQTFWLLDTVSLAVFRLSGRSFLRFIRRRGYNYRQVVIIGRNSRSEDFVSKVESSPELGFRIEGYLDAKGANGNGMIASRYESLGDLEDLEGVLRRLVIDEVYVFLPVKSFYADIEKVLSTCESAGIEVKISTELFIHKIAKSTISYFGEVPLIDLFSSPEMSWQLIVKRLMDIAVSAVMLALFLPVFAVAAVMVKATSKGPVLFRQQRKGYNGRTFNCLKFRTMVEDAEKMKDGLLSHNEMDGPVFKIKDDPRVTKAGHMLRKTSIDELPQLINVLKGDMSLVGPRPPLPEEVNKYDLPYLRRLSMKPGITCLWQVAGRNSVPFQKWMELDKQYIEQWSLKLDFIILFKTIPAVLRGSGER